MSSKNFTLKTMVFVTSKVYKKPMSKKMPEWYKNWWLAFRVLCDARGRGVKTRLAKTCGCSEKHISQVYSGEKGASKKLMGKIANFFGVSLSLMADAGENILEAMERQASSLPEPFPGYTKVMKQENRDSRWNALVEIVCDELGTSRAIFETKIFHDYIDGKIDEVEAYRKLKAQMAGPAEKIERAKPVTEDERAEAEKALREKFKK